MKIHGWFLMTCLLGLLTAALPTWGAKITGATAGDGGDSNNNTFSFSAANLSFQMLNPDNSPLTPAQIPFSYGSALQIFNNGADYPAAWGIKAQGADLSGSLWTDAAFPPLGTMAIDPVLGRFKFASPAWLGATPVDSGSPAIPGFIQVALNAAGQGLAVFSRLETSYHVYANIYQPGRNWLGETLLDSGNTHNANAAAVAMNGSGQAVVAFTQSDGTYQRLAANLYSPGSGWSGSQFVDIGPSGHATSPQAAISDDGHVLVVWCQTQGADARLFARTYSPSTGWYDGVTIDAGGVGTISALAPSLTMNSSGQAVVAFTQVDGLGYNRILANEYQPGPAGWTSATTIDAGPNHHANNAHAAVNSAGQAWVSFQQLDAVNPRLYVNHYLPGSGWASALAIDNGSTYAAYGSALALNDSGQAVCAFIQADASTLNGRLFTRRYDPGSSAWQNSVILDNGPYILGTPQVKLNSAGKALVVFQQLDGPNVFTNHNRIYAQELNPASGAWSGAKEIDIPTALSGAFPQVALNDAGQAICAFNQVDATVTYHNFATVFRGDAPTGTVQVDYYVASAGAPVALENKASVTHRKLEPGQGEKTHIHYGVTRAGMVSVKIYNLRGELARTLVNGFQNAGTYDLDWVGENNTDERVASGVYLIQIKTPSLTETQKVVVIK